ncbi:Imm15 family immunity protein [Pseudomonas sp. NFXW11]|uniref:Imm15 family immunity protein n=1 Tax=Pseudomonas sp. NFXW11 TaxID=2819531 RepID=UPI003CE70248
MKFADFYSRIISKEAYKDMDVFFEIHESFEELPIVSRYSRLDFLRQEMSSGAVADFLTGFAVFLLNTLRLLEASRDENVFFALTFTDFEGLEEQGILIPNIFFYQQPAAAVFLQKLQEKAQGHASREMTDVKRHFSNCGAETAFDFYESRFYDAACAEELVRVFAVPRA